MSTTVVATPIEPRWKSYLAAIGFILPGLVLWCLSTVYFAPKLQQIWKLGGGQQSEAQWVMEAVMFLVRHGGLILGVLAVALVLCELGWDWWARHRRIILGSVVMLLNTAIVSGLWFMCLAALLVAPALSPAR